MNPKAAAASAGAAAILGIPLIGAGVGTGAEDGPRVPEPTPARVRPPTYADLQANLVEARREANHQRRRARRLTRRLRAVIRSSFDPVRAGLLCIHAGEGSWRDPDAPYWGGLQMDQAFMETYGAPLLERFGYAHRWPIGAQLAVGEIAYFSGRGFGPWPNTRRACGI